MDRRFSVPVLILLGLCLVAVGFHFISDELGLQTTGTEETVHYDHLFILPGMVVILSIQGIPAIPIEQIILKNLAIQQPPSPPPNSITLA